MNAPAEGMRHRVIVLLLTLASVWSIGAGIWIAATPQTILETRAVSELGIEATPPTSLRLASFYSIQGIWGLSVFFVFAGLYSGGAWLCWRKQATWAALVSLAAVGLTFLAGFSIGPFYVPAAVLTAAALILSIFSGNRRE